MKASPRLARRGGFTLLEVLLASLIAIMLLAALYFMMDVTLRQTQEGREGVEADHLARNVFNRMTIDMSAALGPLPPKSGGNSNTASSSSSSSGSSGGTTGSTDPTAMATTGTAPATGAADPTATATTDPTTSSDPSATEVPAQPAAADIGFQAGVVGSDKQITIFLSRLPASLSDTRGLSQATDSTIQTPSDQVRVTYWLGANGGLCRQESPWVTADGVRDTVDPDLTNEAGDTIVDEVKDLQFEYFDGTGWTSSWDGSIPGPDGVTPQGPPRAVRVTLWLEIPSSRSGGQIVKKTVVQVIPIRAAPGSMTPTMVDPYSTPTTTDGTTMGATTGGGTTGGTGTTGSGATSGSKSGGATPGGTGASK